MAPDEINNRFSYHTPLPGQAEQYEEIRAAARDYAHMLNIAVPESREKSLALTALDEAVFWANAGIARRPNNNVVLQGVTDTHGQ